MGKVHSKHFPLTMLGALAIPAPHAINQQGEDELEDAPRQSEVTNTWRHTSLARLKLPGRSEQC